jgi:hypothetical protein
MATSRLASLPIDHLIAETAAFPVASPDSFFLHTTCLHPCMKNGTDKLWRSAERVFAGAFPAFSIDELVATRDLLWFAGSPWDVVFLGDYLCKLAADLLEHVGGDARPRDSANSMPSGRGGPGSPWARARRSWRWVSFAIPPDLLLAAMGVGQSEIPRQVHLMAPDLEQCLADRGFAEPHLHIGASMDFATLWAGVLWNLSRYELKEDAFKSPGACFDEGRELGPWLVRGALCRYVLGCFLATDPVNRPAKYNCSDYLSTSVLGRTVEVAGPTAAALLCQALEDLAWARLTRPGAAYSDLQGLYSKLTRLQMHAFPDDLADAQWADPLAPQFSPGQDGLPTPEMQFVARGLGYLQARPKDACFARLFWQVVRLRAVFYRHVVQRPMTPGLQWFVRFYGRLGPAKRHFSQRLLVQAAAQTSGLGRGLRSLELRTTPKPKVTDMLALVQQTIIAAADLTSTENGKTKEMPPGEFELGLVLHLSKDRGGGGRVGLNQAHWINSNADPSDHKTNPTGYRYANFYAVKRREAQSLAWLLVNFPTALKVVRGIDICTDELGVPTWVMVPLFRFLIDTGNHASAVLKQDLGLDISPLRVTAHVGEDYVHLLGGLRRVDESLEYLGLREGDRIGHGVALGVNAQEWSARTARIAQTREERLLDLVWEGRFCRRECIGGGANNRLLKRCHEIARLSSLIFGEYLSPEAVEQLYDDLHREAILKQVGFPQGGLHLAGIDSVTRWPGQPEERRRLDRIHKYLTSPEVFSQGQVLEWIDTSDEGAILEEVQQALKCKVGARNISIEINPSSNLLIGNLGDVRNHPFWQLQPPLLPSVSNPSLLVPAEGATVAELPQLLEQAPTVSVCIGSDDPITFATTLPGEYQLVSDALILAGLSSAAAAGWIDNVRNNGLRARFTLPGPYRTLSMDTVPRRVSFEPIL